jgi:hypothetical protein
LCTLISYFFESYLSIILSIGRFIGTGIARDCGEFKDLFSLEEIIPGA